MIKDMLRNGLKWVSDHLRKKKNIWVFGAWEGTLYADNSKYLFEYINQADKHIQCIWISKNSSVVHHVRSLGYEAYHRASLKGVYYCLRAGAAFITSDVSDISMIIGGKTEVFQLWHGVGAKAMRWQNLDPKEVARFNSYTWMATSDAYIDVLHAATGAAKEKFIVTGYPRNDVFVNPPVNDAVKNILSGHTADKYVLYMPTHRNFGKKSVNVDEFYQIDKAFRENNTVMVYKPHFHELKNVLHLESQFTNIILAKDQAIWGDVYSYIHYFDLLIGDYSSISYDFLCAKKPIVQYVYDIETYKQSDGDLFSGLFDFFEDMPLGPFCYTWEETIQEVLNLLENDTWYEQREKCRKMFHPFDDGKNCARVYCEVIKLCNKVDAEHAKR